MKLLSLLLPLLATTQVLAQDTQDTQNQEKTNVPDEKKQLEQANIKLDDAPHATTFNSIDVPPIPELTSQNFDDTIKEGFWYAIPSLSLSLIIITHLTHHCSQVHQILLSILPLLRLHHPNMADSLRAIHHIQTNHPFHPR